LINGNLASQQSPAGFLLKKPSAPVSKLAESKRDLTLADERVVKCMSEFEGGRLAEIDTPARYWVVHLLGKRRTVIDEYAI
jgi:hypothetical protein